MIGYNTFIDSKDAPKIIAQYDFLFIKCLKMTVILK